MVLKGLLEGSSPVHTVAACEAKGTCMHLKHRSRRLPVRASRSPPSGWSACSRPRRRRRSPTARGPTTAAASSAATPPPGRRRQRLPSAASRSRHTFLHDTCYDISVLAESGWGVQADDAIERSHRFRAPLPIAALLKDIVWHYADDAVSWQGRHLCCRPPRSRWGRPQAACCQ